MPLPQSYTVTLGNQFLLGLLAPMSPVEIDQRLGQAAPARWIAGHIAVCRRGIARYIDATLPELSWRKHFGIGSSSEPSSDWPDLATITADLEATAQALAEHMQAADPAILDAPSEHFFTKEPVTAALNLTFMLWHEAYHLGQIGLIARHFGHPPLA